MESEYSPALEDLLRIWPIAEALSTYLPVGDLISLARSSTILRAALHGFSEPYENGSKPTDLQGNVRQSLKIGQHDTTSWNRLKLSAPYECSSPKHTKKNLIPKPCRYCSRPICDACIVQSSFSRGRENTFQNRVRYLCKPCWGQGNLSRGHRFPLHRPKDNALKAEWYDPDGSTKECCTCTLKVDGTLCLDCKDLQNWEAVASAESQCHGMACTNPLEEDKERRRICLWCDKSLPRQVGGTTRHHWNQRMIDARARNAASRQADLEEYNRKRFKSLTMSRRELRGDEAVRNDPDADLPQFVRHLDTINYRPYMAVERAPSGEAVYHSKRGYWTYNQNFLLAMGARCRKITAPGFDPSVACLKANATSPFARTNGEKWSELEQFNSELPFMSAHRCKEWHELKATILDLLVVQNIHPKQIKQIMKDDYDFRAKRAEYEKVMEIWDTEEYRRAQQKLPRRSTSRGSTSSESTRSRTAIKEFKEKLAAFGVGKRLSTTWEILTSSDSDADEEDAALDTSSIDSSPRERDMWADDRGESGTDSGASDEVVDSGSAPFPSVAIIPQQSVPITISQPPQQSSLQRQNTNQTEVDPIDLTSHTEGGPAERDAGIGALGSSLQPPAEHSDNPPPYSAEGWDWPPSP
ncbi:hypothetical protein LTR84_001431 [Exophiala bonariae]|uniref:Clr5 domain-containing protein n=1 Tax=Exophiala bonariae TaxID=1690606 RepID=A0AAV9NDS0_9EURO|nr:hypothetical protein LTR84_001431 [Exophiala bonariae]